MSAGAPRVHGGAQDRPLAGVAANATAFLAITFGDALSKLVITTGPILQTLAIRGVFFMILMAPLFLAARRRGEPLFATKRPGPHIARGIVNGFSVFAYFIAMRHLAFTTMVSIMLVTPVFVALSGVVMLGERIRPAQAGAIATGLAGGLIIINPAADDASWWTLVALGSSITWGVSQTFLRLLARTESAATILIWANAPFISVVLVLAAIDWEPVEPAHIAMLFAMAITQVVGQWFSTLAFRLAPAATVAPVQYTQMVWATLLGVAIWSEWPAAHVWAGVALVIAGGIWLVRAEGRRIAG